LRPCGASLLHRHRHRLDLGVIPQRVFAQFAADAGHLEAAEGGGGVEDVVAVDPDRAGLELGGEAVGLADVARPDRRRPGRTCVRLPRSITSSMSLNGMIDMTGPKISSQAIFISSFTSVKTVGSMK
jgi:hypothetical protein